MIMVGIDMLSYLCFTYITAMVFIHILMYWCGDWFSTRQLCVTARTVGISFISILGTGCRFRIANLGVSYMIGWIFFSIWLSTDLTDCFVLTSCGSSTTLAHHCTTVITGMLSFSCFVVSDCYWAAIVTFMVMVNIDMLSYLCFTYITAMVFVVILMSWCCDFYWLRYLHCPCFIWEEVSTVFTLPIGFVAIFRTSCRFRIVTLNTSYMVGWIYFSIWLATDFTDRFVFASCCSATATNSYFASITIMVSIIINMVANFFATVITLMIKIIVNMTNINCYF